MCTDGSYETTTALERIEATAVPVLTAVREGAVLTDVPVTHRTTALLRGLVEVFHHHGASLEVRTCLEKQVRRYLDSSIDEKVWLKRAKYLLTYPMARYLRNEAPNPPDLKPSFSGPLRGWFKSRLVAFNRKNTHLWYSWLQAKRCSLQASDKFVRETYREHYQQLSAPDKGVDVTIDKIMSQPHFTGLLDEIAAVVANDYNSRRPQGSYMQASHNACFQKTRRRGGAARYLGEMAGLLSKWKPTEVVEVDPGFEPGTTHYYGDWNGELWSMSDSYQSRRTDSGYQRTHFVNEVRTPSGATDFVDEVEGHFRRHELWRSLNCTIQAVLEPFKVRVISKGEALPYYVARPLQKALHGALRNLPCFRLLGEPFCASQLLTLTPRFSKVLQLASHSGREEVDNDVYYDADYTTTEAVSRFKVSPSGEQFEWFSVDYSAATDNLSWKYSSQIFSRVIRGLPKAIQALAMQVLGPHRLWYPNSDMKPEYWGDQTTGQLMGSILSFPILCLANLGVYLLNTNEFHCDADLNSRLEAVLINGDDMLYVAPPSLWKSHVQISSEVGLQMTPGKAYHHPVYANANSTSVHCDLRRDDHPFRIDYLNLGLYFGQRKVQGNADTEYGRAVEEFKVGSRHATPERISELYAAAHMTQEPDSGLVSNIPIIMSGCLPGKQCSTLSRYLTLHAKEIRAECTCILVRNGREELHTRNIFIPKFFGGMGVPLPAGFKTKVTTDDRFLAGCLAERCPVPYDRALPLRGREFEADLDFRPAAWQDLTDNLDIPSFVLTKIKCPSRSRVLLPAYPFDRDRVSKRMIRVYDEIDYEQQWSPLFGHLFSQKRGHLVTLPKHELELDSEFRGFYEPRKAVIKNEGPNALDERWFSPSESLEDWSTNEDFDVFFDAEGPCDCTGNLFGVSQYCRKCILG